MIMYIYIYLFFAEKPEKERARFSISFRDDYSTIQMTGHIEMKLESREILDSSFPIGFSFFRYLQAVFFTMRELCT